VDEFPMLILFGFPPERPPFNPFFKPFGQEVSRRTLAQRLSAIFNLAII